MRFAQLSGTDLQSEEGQAERAKTPALGACLHIATLLYLPIDLQQGTAWQPKSAPACCVPYILLKVGVASHPIARSSGCAMSLCRATGLGHGRHHITVTIYIIWQMMALQCWILFGRGLRRVLLPRKHLPQRRVMRTGQGQYSSTHCKRRFLNRSIEHHAQKSTYRCHSYRSILNQTPA